MPKMDLKASGASSNRPRASEGERLFVAHMIERELIMLNVAPLLVLSGPIAAMLLALAGAGAGASARARARWRGAGDSLSIAPAYRSGHGGPHAGSRVLAMACTGFVQPGFGERGLAYGATSSVPRPGATVSDGDAEPAGRSGCIRAVPCGDLDRLWRAGRADGVRDEPL